MISIQESLSSSICNTLLVFSLLLTSTAAVSQVATVAIPDHASPKKYGEGWSCNRGFREIDHRCDPVVVPENGYPTYTRYGTGWTCARGFLEHNGECRAIRVPAHGYLTNQSYSPGWKCERGYRANGENCTLINVPEHGSPSH